MCPQVNGILEWIAGHNAEFVQNLECSWVFGLAITAAVRFQMGTFLVSPMGVTSLRRLPVISGKDPPISPLRLLLI